MTRFPTIAHSWRSQKALTITAIFTSKLSSYMMRWDRSCVIQFWWSRFKASLRTISCTKFPFVSSKAKFSISRNFFPRGQALLIEVGSEENSKTTHSSFLVSTLKLALKAKLKASP